MDTADEPSLYTLEDLAAQTGFDARVIRSFIEQDLLLGPSSLGRYARYSDAHLTRLLAIKALKEKRGLKHSDIRQTLLCMSDGEVLALAETARTPQVQEKTSALDYIRSLNTLPFIGLENQQNAFLKPGSPGLSPPDAGHTEPPQTQNPALRNQRSNNQSQRQQPVSELWHRFQITPDVELSVRGIQTEQQMARIKSITNYLREILIGGQNEGQ